MFDEGFFKQFFPQKPTAKQIEAKAKALATTMLDGRSLTGEATNSKTGEKRIVKVGITTLEKAQVDGDKCSGPCNHPVEVDGHCPKGWPSRTMVMIG